MKIVLFTLTGDIALWRNVYDSIGSYSCLGPAPSALAGLCGAALGFCSPRSASNTQMDQKTLEAQKKRGLPWPVAPELLDWLQKNDAAFACRWTGGFPKRPPWNVNGLKELCNTENLRIQQQVIEHPSYEVSVRLNSDQAAAELASALKTPAFRLYLGCTMCPAIVRDIRLADCIPETSDWAFPQKHGALGEATPLSRLSVNAAETGERIVIDGYWIYPIPSMPGKLQSDPFTKGHV